MRKKWMWSILFIVFLMINMNVYAERIVVRTSLQNSIPKYFEVEENGEMIFTGICIDIMKAIESIDSDIEFVFDHHFIPFARIANDLEVGYIDVFLGMIWNEERDRLYNFVYPPLYPTYNLLVVRADDPIQNIESIDKLRKMGTDGIILVDHATAHQRFLEELGGLNIDSGGRNRNQNLTKLLSGRGRFYYSTDIGLVGTINEMEIQGKVRFLPYVLVEDFQYAAFSKHAPADMIEKIVEAITQLSENGTLSEIRAKYIH